MHSYAAFKNNNNSLNCLSRFVVKMDFEFITNEAVMTYLSLNRLLREDD